MCTSGLSCIGGHPTVPFFAPLDLQFLQFFDIYTETHIQVTCTRVEG